MSSPTHSAGPQPSPPAHLAADRAASAEQLRELAMVRPELRPTIALNPAAYPELLTWLGQLGDPAVDAALQARAAHEQAARRRRRQIGLSLVVVLLLLALAAVLSHGFGLLGRSGSSSAQATDSAPGSSPATEPLSQASAAPSEPQAAPAPSSPTDQASAAVAPAESDQPAWPVPAGAIHTSGFHTPGMTIGCLFPEGSGGPDELGVLCNIDEAAWLTTDGTGGQATPELDCTASLGGSVLTEVSASSTGSRCGEPLLFFNGTLDYGQSAFWGDYACTVYLGGVTCWHTRTGQSVGFSHSGRAFGSHGPFVEAGIP
ncbi:MAG: hypothetical protein SO046_00815 [Actinomyces urogenitalis]|uniref:variant leucine-rich repeat-containing protein n=1 Tax=Actinomyces urogenitalis TaxID=103621 RepID=UPI002A8096E9|nr:hypothetical protein [Actinomyces urogenitalis]MDY3677752.1 hypothetical protein [Actinomyces urogenitalis]